MRVNPCFSCFVFLFVFFWLRRRTDNSDRRLPSSPKSIAGGPSLFRLTPSIPSLFLPCLIEKSARYNPPPPLSLPVYLSFYWFFLIRLFTDLNLRWNSIPPLFSVYFSKKIYPGCSFWPSFKWEREIVGHGESDVRIVFRIQQDLYKREKNKK